MSVATIVDLERYCLDVAKRAHAAAIEMAQTSGAVREAFLRAAARLVVERRDLLLEANAIDLAAAPDHGLSAAQIDRLSISRGSIDAMAAALLEVAAQPDPLGETIESRVRPSGLDVRKVRVPLGVVFFIYESRPNVTVDAAGICVKSGNAVILRGGKEAARSNQELAATLELAAREAGLPADAVQMVSTIDREAVGLFLRMPEYITVAIPRGGESLIRRVADEARMPVIKHFAGNCHVYVDASADLDAAERVTVNAKCQRMGVCNAAESLVVHVAVAEKFLPRVAQALGARGIELRGDVRSRRLAPAILPATEDDYAAEYLGPVMSVKVVDSLAESIAHINRYGSHHTDAILTRDLDAAREFTARVDSAAVMVNASTRLNDGGALGLGAEIGISTDKLHARGPCGVKELTSYKYIVHGQGHVRE